MGALAYHIAAYVYQLFIETQKNGALHRSAVQRKQDILEREV